MSFITDLLSKGTAGLATGVSTIISNFKADPTKVDELANNLQTLIENNKQATIQALEQQYEADLKDIQNARDMAIQLANAKNTDWISKAIVPILAIFCSLIWGGVTGYIVLRVLDLIASNPNVNMTVLMGIYAALTGIQGQVFGYYFGSSSGSKAKDDTIATIAKSQ